MVVVVDLANTYIPDACTPAWVDEFSMYRLVPSRVTVGSWAVSERFHTFNSEYPREDFTFEKVFPDAPVVLPHTALRVVTTHVEKSPVANKSSV
tara:strand:- start:38 stop:319 length:282 start_codon:yes stop_codon:yes gene_type:complete